MTTFPCLPGVRATPIGLDTSIGAGCRWRLADRGDGAIDSADRRSASTGGLTSTRRAASYPANSSQCIPVTAPASSGRLPAGSILEYSDRLLSVPIRRWSFWGAAADGRSECLRSTVGHRWRRVSDLTRIAQAGGKEGLVVGQARIVTAETVEAVRALAEALEGVMADGKVTPLEQGTVRRRISHLRICVKRDDHRLRTIRLLTGAVSDVRNTQKHLALVGLPANALDEPLDAA